MTKLEQGFETVHVVHDYWDGPRSGVAEYGGRPHWFENIFDEQQDDYSDLFWLTPLSEETLGLAQQQEGYSHVGGRRLVGKRLICPRTLPSLRTEDPTTI